MPHAYKTLKNSQDSFDGIWGREICMALLHPMKLSIYMVLGVPNFYGWLVGDQHGDMASACMTVHQRSGLRSHQDLRWITIPWLQPMNTDSPGQHPKYSCDFWDSNRRFDGIGMCTVGQHLTCAMVALAQSLAGNSLSSVNLLRCIPNGRYKWKPFLELLSQVVCENATTFASSGSTWNSMVSFCCVLTMYRSDYLSWFVLYTYIVHSHISWTNRTSIMYNRWVMSHESWVKSWGLWHVSADFPGRTSTLMMTSVMTEVVGWRSFLFWVGKDPQ